MRLDRLKTFALALPQTTVIKQWGECLVFKVAGKMFLLIPLDGGVINGLSLKCTPTEFNQLMEIDGIIQALRRPAPLGPGRGCGRAARARAAPVDPPQLRPCGR